MTIDETPAAVAAGRAVLRLLASLARRPVALDPGSEAFGLVRRRGWIEPDGRLWRLSRTGREFLRRAISGQDLATAGATAAAGGEVRRGPAENADESPLARLRRHKGRDGTSLISDDEFLAGERLRADFWYAGMTPRVTMRWDGVVGGGGTRGAPGAGVEIGDQVVAAGERVRRALAAVGPELSGVLVDVCCHLKGIEDAERHAGWPQRSGKVVLRIALAALARHYGIAQVAAAEPPRHWGAADYRPRLDAWR